MTTPHTAAGRKVVLDASALLAWLLDEIGANTVQALLRVGVAPASAMVEALYRSQELGSRLSIEELYQALLAQGLTVEAIRGDDTVRAASLIRGSRTRGGRAKSLSLGDGLCLAVAERLGLPVTGGDQDWAVEDLTVPFLPFR